MKRKSTTISAVIRNDWTINNKRLSEFYPEAKAGGYTNIDSTILFYLRINALLTEQSTVLNLGAGRGERLLGGDVPFRAELENIRGRTKYVIGVDIGETASNNPGLSHHISINTDGTIPIDDNSIDLVICDWVIEHIENPKVLVSEISRVLRPGGWFCARTTNKNGYIAIASRLIPKRIHKLVISVVQPRRLKEDVFPTFYRMNTPSALRDLFDSQLYEHAITLHTPEPSYAGQYRMLWIATIIIQSLLPRILQPVIFVFLRKKY